MYTDLLNTVSSAQAVTTSAVSTNVIDLGPQARDIGEGKKLIMEFSVGATFTGGTSIEFQVIGSVNSTLSPAVVLGTSGAIPIADPRVKAGQIVYVDFNSLYMSTGYRYIGANYNIVGTMTGGNISAGIVETVEDFKTYNSGFTVV